MSASQIAFAVLIATAAVSVGCGTFHDRYYPDECGGPTGVSMRFAPGEGPVTDCGHCGGHGSGCCWGAWRDGWRRMLGCSSGCGDIYWGEEWYDPPDACDPCDDCGNWIGPQSCPTRREKAVSGLMGQRFCMPGCAGCDRCWGVPTGPSDSIRITEPSLEPTPADYPPIPRSELYYDR